MKKIMYPFSAVVGQERMKQALLMNVIDPSIGGVLIRGAKGTAKSTIVRSLEDILPKRMAADCVFHCVQGDGLCEACQEKQKKGTLQFTQQSMRVVELPINTTQDRLAGTIDIERALRDATKALEPGILAYANQNILYIDEVNLLSDHLVDIILDAAAMGVHYVEREGISAQHPARFVLVGTMNPEEGELRPQLLDRFGLVVDVHTEHERTRRVELMDRRLAFERDPEGFCHLYEPEQEKLRQQIRQAKELLEKVTYDEKTLESIASVAIALELEGHRAEITALKASRVLAAWRGEKQIGEQDILDALGFVLPHRLRRLPFEEIIHDPEDMMKLLKEKECFPFLPS